MFGNSQSFDVNLMQEELRKSGRKSGATDIVGTLLEVDEAIKNEKAKIDNISRNITVLDIAVTVFNLLLVAGSVIMLKYALKSDKFETERALMNAVFISVPVLNAMILAYASWTIRNTVLAQSNLEPNQTLIRVHIINSIIFIVLQAG